MRTLQVSGRALVTLFSKHYDTKVRTHPCSPPLARWRRWASSALATTFLISTRVGRLSRRPGAGTPSTLSAPHRRWTSSVSGQRVYRDADPILGTAAFPRAADVRERPRPLGRVLRESRARPVPGRGHR